jgi:hypothetical protein
MVERPNLRLCIDRMLPQHVKIKAADLAIAENPKNQPKLPPFLPGVSHFTAKIAFFTGKRWAKEGRTLRVRFLDGSPTQRQKVREHATSWSKYCNITFDFSESPDAEVRVSFVADPGSWSAVGTDCLLTEEFKPDQPTMNFGWLRDDTDDVEYRRVVVHEFGHALGAIHEHQSPKGGIQWNLPAVYAYFSGPPNNWTKDDIDFNVVQKYSASQLNATKFDRRSIMLYTFPPELIVGHLRLPLNTSLSTGDKKFVAKMYPPKKGAKKARH